MPSPRLGRWHHQQQQRAVASARLHFTPFHSNSLWFLECQSMTPSPTTYLIETLIYNDWITQDVAHDLDTAIQLASAISDNILDGNIRIVTPDGDIV